MYFLGTKTLKYIQDKKKGKICVDWGNQVHDIDPDSSVLETDESMLNSDETPSTVKKPKTANLKNTFKMLSQALTS